MKKLFGKKVVLLSMVVMLMLVFVGCDSDEFGSLVVQMEEPETADVMTLANDELSESREDVSSDEIDSLAVGEYTLTVESEGYETKEIPVQIVEDETTTVNVTMTPEVVEEEEEVEEEPVVVEDDFNLSVLVTDKNQNPLIAEVSLLADGEVKEMRKASEFTFDQIPAGTYTLEVARGGLYEDVTREVELNDNKDVTVELPGGGVEQHLISKGSAQESITIENLAHDEEAIVAASYLDLDSAPADFDGDLEYNARQRGLSLIGEYGADFEIDIPEYSLGESRTFEIADDVKAGEVEATLEAKGEHIYVFADNEEDVSEAKIDELVVNFDNNIYQQLTPEAKNHEEVVVLLTEFDRAEGEPFVTGFFDPVNLYPGEGNELPMFYLNSTRPENTMLTAAAHQYHHLVFFDKKANMGSSVDDAWIDEGLAHLSSQLSGYINFGKHGWSDEQANGWVYDDQYGYLNNTDQVNLLFQDGSLPLQGAVGLFASYLVEQYGAELAVEVMNTPEDPTEVIADFTGKDFEQIYTNWITTNVTDNIEAIDEEVYNYNNFNLNMMPKFQEVMVSDTGVSYVRIDGEGGSVELPLPEDRPEDLVVVVIRNQK